MLQPVNGNWSAVHKQVGISILLAGRKAVRRAGRVDITEDGVLVGKIGTHFFNRITGFSYTCVTR